MSLPKARTQTMPKKFKQAHDDPAGLTILAQQNSTVRQAVNSAKLEGTHWNPEPTIIVDKTLSMF